MKLLYITNGINGSGGLERVLSIKASYFAEHYGYQVSILVLNNTHQNPFYNFSPKICFYSINTGGNFLHYWHSYKNGIGKIVEQLHPDIISVCDDGLKGFFVPLFIKTKAKIIYERHVSKLIEIRAQHSFAKKLVTKTKWFLMDCLAEKFSRFIVLTDGNKKEWKGITNMIVIPNPLSFYPEVSSDLENKTVICVGKISYQKGQDLLVKAWEKVRKNHPNWRLELYGKTNAKFLEVGNLEQKNIFYFPPEKNIQQKYLKSSVYVMSSRFEGFGMVLTEAMSCGLPCVSFDCNYGPSDIITHDKDGFLVENGNIDDLAEKLASLMDDKNLRQVFSKSAKESVKRYLPENVALKWDELFKSLLA